MRERLQVRLTQRWNGLTADVAGVTIEARETALSENGAVRLPRTRITAGGFDAWPDSRQ